MARNPPDPHELVTDSQMARMLRVTVRWIRSEAEASRIPCVRAERRLLFAPAVVRKTLAERAATELIGEVSGEHVHDRQDELDALDGWWNEGWSVYQLYAELVRIRGEPGKPVEGVRKGY